MSPAPSNEIVQLRRELAAGTLEGTLNLPVTILLEDGSRYDHDGKLAFLEVTVDPTTGSFTLRVNVPNPKHLLLPGMYVRTIIAAGIRHGAILAPQRGIARDATGNTSALIVDADGKVERRAVTVSRTIEDQWLIESGLAEGDRVIVEGLQKIQPGVPVQASELSAAAPPGDEPTHAASPTN